MAKYLNTQDLAELVGNLLTNPESLGCFDEKEQFRDFVWEIAHLLTSHCGGYVYIVSDELNPAGVFEVGIVDDESLPSIEHNVWAKYDPEGEL